jgi:hypothetical protein
MVYSNAGGGEYIFVKGSDQAVWMRHNGAWTSLGGMIFGDPSAFVASIYGYQGVIYIVGLGLDDQMYLQDILDGTPSGWYGPIPAGGTTFVGSPIGISRAPNTFDFFAVNEGGDVKQISWNSSTGWAAPVTPIGDISPDVIVSTPTVAVDANGEMELFGTGQFSAWETRGNGSSWASAENGKFALPAKALVTYGMQGSMASVSWGPMHYDAFAVSRKGELWWWYMNSVNYSFQGWSYQSSPLVPSTLMPANTPAASGDPLAISRETNEVEVFYRTSNGQLAHLILMDGVWGAPEISLMPGSIQ